MADFCIICLTEAVSIEDWYYNEKSTEFVCPWCKDNLISIRKTLEVDGS